MDFHPSSMSRQEELNNRARMEASDETLAVELQKELDGAGGDYLIGSEFWWRRRRWE